MSEDGSQKPDDGGQRADNGGTMTENGLRRTEMEEGRWIIDLLSHI